MRCNLQQQQGSRSNKNNDSHGGKRCQSDQAVWQSQARTIALSRVLELFVDNFKTVKTFGRCSLLQVFCQGFPWITEIFASGFLACLGHFSLHASGRYHSHLSAFSLAAFRTTGTPPHLQTAHVIRPASQELEACGFVLARAS